MNLKLRSRYQRSPEKHYLNVVCWLSICQWDENLYQLTIYRGRVGTFYQALAVNHSFGVCKIRVEWLSKGGRKRGEWSCRGRKEEGRVMYSWPMMYGSGLSEIGAMWVIWSRTRCSSFVQSSSIFRAKCSALVNFGPSINDVQGRGDQLVEIWTKIGRFHEFTHI